MTKDEALNLALKALTATMSTHGFRDAIDKAHEKAITAIKEALAQPEQIQPSVYPNTHQSEQEQCSSCGGFCKRSGCERADYVPPEQEPVAWRNAAIRVGEDLCSVGPFGYYDMTAAQWLDWALSVVTVHAPPQRKPLTDEEIEDYWEHITGHSIFGGDRSAGRPMFVSADEVTEFARAIDAHGIQ